LELVVTDEDIIVSRAEIGVVEFNADGVAINDKGVEVLCGAVGALGVKALNGGANCGAFEFVLEGDQNGVGGGVVAEVAGSGPAVNGLRKRINRFQIPAE